VSIPYGAKQVEAGSRYIFSFAILNNGAVTGWGSMYNNNLVSGLSGVVDQISVGRYWSQGQCWFAALLKNGTIEMRGYFPNNAAGSGIFYTHPTSGLTGVKQVSLGYNHGLALLSDGTITGWGTGPYGEDAPHRELTGVIQVSAGEYHSLVLLQNGKVTGWGNNSYGLSLGGNNLTGVKQISAGGRHSMALLADGTITGWGEDSWGIITSGGNLQNVSKVLASSYSSLVLFKDGTVKAWGNDQFGRYPTEGNALTGVLDISCWDDNNLAILSNGSVTGWGISGAEKLIFN
jgi:alpha-tubulin suppressor-like RCC1 family protein